MRKYNYKPEPQKWYIKDYGKGFVIVDETAHPDGLIPVVKFNALVEAQEEEARYKYLYEEYSSEVEELQHEREKREEQITSLNEDREHLQKCINECWIEINSLRECVEFEQSVIRERESMNALHLCTIKQLEDENNRLNAKLEDAYQEIEEYELGGMTDG